MITATLTRPTAIAPTMTCDKRVMLVEKIDVGHLPPPRSRTIFLEPISRRKPRKKSAVLDKPPVIVPDPGSSNAHNDHASEAGSVERSATTAESMRDGHFSENARAPTQIDLRSEISGESGRSISTAVSRSDVTPLSHVSAYKSPAKQKVLDNKTITATIELLKAGCLAGDTVTVRVSVQHIKRLKSMTGVIVTLYRQGTIDSAPSASLFSGNDFEDGRIAGDDGYPRSRTGLAGLSLSSTGSTSMFRKDLDQNTAPLIIDPSSLHASVTVSLKLPDDAFPTIRGTPGGMVCFRYNVEVIVDLGGKLSNQVMQGGQSSSTRFGQNTYGASDGAYGPRVAMNIIDTSPLRRQKGVVAVSMETIVGTVDSSRRRKPPRISPRHQSLRVQESDEDEVIRAEFNDRTPTASSPAIYTSPPGGGYAPQTSYLHPSRANGGPSGPPQPDYHSHTQVNGHSREAAPAYIPQPQMPDSRNMSEKERIRHAETRLLPSQPPAAGPSSSSASAPGDDNIYDAHETPSAPPEAGPSAPSADEAAAGPSAPTESDLNGSASYPVEDKQELERQRLINEASAPPEFPEDMQRSNDQSPTTEDDAGPSAPVLDEDEEELAGYGVGAGPSSSSAGPSTSGARGQNGEQLPAYER